MAKFSNCETFFNCNFQGACTRGACVDRRGQGEELALNFEVSALLALFDGNANLQIWNFDSGKPVELEAKEECFDTDYSYTEWILVIVMSFYSDFRLLAGLKFEYSFVVRLDVNACARPPHFPSRSIKSIYTHYD